MTEQKGKRGVPEAASVKMTTQKLTLTNRKEMALSGVSEVLKFDTETIVLATASGNLTIRGNDLKMGRLNVDTGELQLTGFVNGLFYSAGEREGHGLRKLFG